MKRLLSILLCAAICLGCVGCAVDTYEGKILLPQWGGDLKRHWYIGEDGAVSQKGRHTLGDNEICTVCGATVSHYVGGATLSIPNQFGDVVVYKEFDQSGKLTWDTYNYYEHDENGEMTYQKTYDGDRLQEEHVYQKGQNGEKPIPKVTTYYDVSGTTDRMTYNEIGDMIQMEKLDENGVLFRTERYERVYGEDSNLRNEKIFIDDVLTTERVYVDDGFGFYYIGEEITYNPDGTVADTVKYDIDGNVIE